MDSKERAAQSKCPLMIPWISDGALQKTHVDEPTGTRCKAAFFELQQHLTEPKPHVHFRSTGQARYVTTIM